MAGYMVSSVVKNHLDALANNYPFVTRSGPGDWSPGWRGGNSGYVKISKTTPDSPANRWAVLITGGVHARELAPPDALVSFLEKMLAAYVASSAITYPAWTDPIAKIRYDPFTVPWPWVKQAVESLDIYVVPLVNDDGRDWVRAVPPGASQPVHELHTMWRKNRRPAPAGVTDPRGIGVDLNRNFDILWNYPKYYNTALPNIDIQSSTDPLDETYVGDVASGAAESEPETKNVAKLMRDKNIGYFLDVHQFARDVLYSWGIESDQTTDASQSFTNRAKDGQRDGVHNSGYAEYIPANMEAAVQAVAQTMCDQILALAGGSDPVAQKRSTYKPMAGSALYVTTGAADDYCFSRWFAPMAGGPATSPVMAFTIEVGGDPSHGPDYDDGGFTPHYTTQYPKLEREIHVAVWSFLGMAAATAYQAPSAPPVPAPPPPVSSGGGCTDVLLVTILMLLAMVAALVATG